MYPVKNVVLSPLQRAVWRDPWSLHQSGSRPALPAADTQRHFGFSVIIKTVVYWWVNRLILVWISSKSFLTSSGRSAVMSSSNSLLGEDQVFSQFHWLELFICLSPSVVPTPHHHSLTGSQLAFQRTPWAQSLRPSGARRWRGRRYTLPGAGRSGCWPLSGWWRSQSERRMSGWGKSLSLGARSDSPCTAEDQGRKQRQTDVGLKLN